jgi:hypothetical protein
MLIIRKLLTITLIAFACVSNANSYQRKVIEPSVLNSEIFSLYEDLNYISILEDGEYADLKEGEKYWLAIDSRHEYLSLRTINNIIVEVIIRNPDITTLNGLGAGDNLERLKTLYPDMVKLTHYSNGVKRRGEHFYLPSEKIEVSFNREGLISSLSLKRDDKKSIAVQKGELNFEDKLAVNEVVNYQLYENVRSTFSSCTGKPASASVLISPKKFPKSYKGKNAVIKFLVGEDSKPYEVEFIEGNMEISEWSLSSLLRSRFPREQASCWLVKYEYAD